MKFEITFIVLVIVTVLLSGCTAFEDENEVCQALFEDGSFVIPLNETSATSCDEYAGVMVISGVCKSGVFCIEKDESCFCFHTSDGRDTTYEQYKKVRE